MTVGQKTHPYGFRLVYNKTWHSRWFAEGDYAKLLHSDLALRMLHVAGTLTFSREVSTLLDVGLIKVEPGEEWQTLPS